MSESGPPIPLEDSVSTTSAIIPARLQVLQNEDILAIILWFFANSEETGEFRVNSELVSVSLTCRSFVKAALDLLWMNMQSLTPLFKILPTFVRVNDIYTFDGEILPEHFERFKMYARKIRTLTVRSLPDSIASHCIHRLTSIPDLSELFPALREINLWLEHNQKIDNISPLFLAHGSLLTTITVGCISSHNQSPMSSLLLHLSHKAPTIQEIHLCGALSSEILRIFKRFKKLEILTLLHSSDILDFPISIILPYLYDLPDLWRLSLKIDKSNLDVSTSLLRQNIAGFQALESLDLSGYPSEILKILDGIGKIPELCYLSCQLDSEPPPLYASIQRCIAECCRIAPNMQNFYLSSDDTIKLPAGSPSNILAPCIQRRQIVDLRFRNVDLLTNDDDIREFGESGAWKNLCTLHFTFPLDEGPTHSLTSLRILAQNCPKLTDLVIPIDFRAHTPSSLQEERRYPRASHPLVSLVIGNMYEESYTGHSQNATEMAVAVARFLEHYFPNLGRSGSKMELESLSQDDKAWWNVVKAIFAGFQDLRAAAESDIREVPRITA